MKPQRIIISRTDSIGDVMLTLPMCGLIKQQIPECEIIFLGRTYTEAVIRCCAHVNHFENWDDWKDLSPQSQVDALAKWNADVIVHVFPRKEIMWVAKRAHIALRIATGRRLHTITKCNRLVFFSRKKSTLHEAQLNMKLLKPLGIEAAPQLDEIAELYGFSAKEKLPENIAKLIDKKKINVVLHPKSKGSAVEWSLSDFNELAELLPQDKFNIFITGTKAEGEAIAKELDLKKFNALDLAGKLTLPELITLISACDALIAASTGPLHIASALGKHAIGLYSPKRPIHPGRWAPVGKNAEVLVAETHPVKGFTLNISARQVADRLFSK